MLTCKASSFNMIIKQMKNIIFSEDVDIYNILIFHKDVIMKIIKISSFKTLNNTIMTSSFKRMCNSKYDANMKNHMWHNIIIHMIINTPEVDHVQRRKTSNQDKIKTSLEPDVQIRWCKGNYDQNVVNH